MATWWRAAIAGVAVLALAIVGFLYLPSFGNVSARSLAESVARELGTSSFEQCERERKHWRCAVEDREGSTEPVYRVTMTSSRCWRARKVSHVREDGDPLDRRADGCAQLRDQLRPLDRLPG